MVAILVIVISLMLFAISGSTLWWMMHAWRTPETLAATSFQPPDGDCLLSFSLLVPARHEERVLEHTIRRMLESSHTNFEIIIIVGHDDPATTAVANMLAEAEPQRVRVVVDTNVPKNKPKALNTALPYCRGEIVGVFDAEDQIHPDLFMHVDYAFRATQAAVVQGGVQLVNFQSSWYSLRNCLEYFFWFRSRLHLHAEKGFIPLGGNTVFVRSEVLREATGWDASCLAEDCDLGVRLSSRRARVVVSYDPLLVTREETPDSLYGLFKQRTRWNQGFLQVFGKKDWKALPSQRQRWLARYTLATPFVQAFMGVLVPFGVLVALLLHMPAVVALISFLPILPTAAILAFEIIGLYDFGRQYQFRVGLVHYVKLVIGSPFYQLMLAGAAMRAVWRQSRGHHNWELTAHVGAHLPTGQAVVAAPAVAE